MMFRTIQTLAVAALVACSAAANASEIRRVVTGLDANDKAVVLFDSRVPLRAGPFGLQATNLWVTNSYPLGFSFKDDTAATPVGISPLDNGTKFRVVEFPPLDPATEAKMEPGGLMKAVGPVAPARGRPVTHPLMHRTRSVDYAVVLSGEIDMVLDDTSVHLKPGDTVVQQATNHAWVNHGTETCRILFVLMDSKQP
ncbi:MAG: cupin domain-containing protein [Bradyrhizobium sp.]|jgi:mannose-6-phosphate isomerase-like protein (cupin superfamily)|uniref:cupin domain-containing protein n=2 Tax=Bradyrhizobium sp. TaxID=376 RepID=UPI003BB19769